MTGTHGPSPCAARRNPRRLRMSRHRQRESATERGRSPFAGAGPAFCVSAPVPVTTKGGRVNRHH